MEQFKGHTPGPWRYIDATKVASMQFKPMCVIKAGDRQLASFGWHDDSPYFPNKEASQANARLIAAAPDLLRQRDELLQALEDTYIALTYIVDGAANIDAELMNRLKEAINNCKNSQLQFRETVFRLKQS